MSTSRYDNPLSSVTESFCKVLQKKILAVNPKSEHSVQAETRYEKKCF
jgi:hypothetical protein